MITQAYGKRNDDLSKASTNDNSMFFSIAISFSTRRKKGKDLLPEVCERDRGW